MRSSFTPIAPANRKWRAPRFQFMVSAGFSILAIGALALLLSWTGDNYLRSTFEQAHGLRPDYFHCITNHRGPFTGLPDGPDPYVLWAEVYRNATPTPSDLSRDQPHFLAEVISCSRDILEGRPVFLQQFGIIENSQMQKAWEAHEIHELTREADGRGWRDAASGLPVIFTGDSIQGFADSHDAARRAVVAWYAARGIYPVNSTKRKKP